jgi:hypothetical protein
MAFTRGANVVTNGLVLCLDAANRKSYPGSGTTWLDLSGNNNSGTLVSGPTFTNDSGGGILFDGSNDEVNLGNNAITQFSHTSAWTIFYFFKIVTFIPTFPGILVKGGASSVGVLMFYASDLALLWKHNNVQNAFPKTTLGLPTCICMTYSGSGNVLGYFNGTYYSTFGTMAGTETSNNLLLGRGDAYGNNILYNFYKYNRALTAEEVQQNYNALKPRYNL